MGCNASQEQFVVANENDNAISEPENNILWLPQQQQEILPQSKGEMEATNSDILTMALTADVEQIVGASTDYLSGGGVTKGQESTKQDVLVERLETIGYADKTEMDSNTTNSNQFDQKDVEAITKIQAVFRGHKVRAALKPGEDDSKIPTKEELEAEFDLNDKDLCDAAVRIQATFRGHLSRKGKEVKDEKDIQEIAKKVAEELDIDLADPELNKAASKIQASFRKHRKD